MEDNIRKSDLYKQYYSDPVFREPWEKVREALMDAFPKTAAGDTATRERIYLMLGLLSKIDEFVGRTIASGEIDKRNLAELTEARKRGIFGLTH
ncbi:hypothetical protein [Methylobacterium sp. 37f]|uniref:hypothetical protein n=1 Tax=Methylobacterium sp. 37f TaxID=2817058 RepID=UPI001FFDA308|nr:hypothetical protein [Methylobacterium sp. 37f]MCK2054748.1 hypothetical protein [Methylobacterium sp. 37f]